MEVDRDGEDEAIAARFEWEPNLPGRRERIEERKDCCRDKAVSWKRPGQGEARLLLVRSIEIM